MMQFFLPYNALPSNGKVRRRILDEYFPSDLVPFEELIDNKWRITAFTPKDPSFYVDPNLERSLRNWYEPVKIETIGSYWSVYKNGFLSMNDSWSLFYWSLVLKWLKDKGIQPRKIVLLHIDDHVDQGPPLLIKGENNFKCIFSGQVVDLSDPRSIEHALNQKSINIRSFVTPFLHSLEAVDVLHLRYAHSGGVVQANLACTTEEDPILACGQLRPIITKTIHQGGHRYVLSADLHSLLNTVEENAVLFLHIDCDAFNNRYNGDSAWNHHPSSIDLSLTEIKRRVTDLLESISRLPVHIFLNVALSPGFFPSEYWQTTCEHIFEMAERVGIVKDDSFSDYLQSYNKEKNLYEAFA